MTARVAEAARLVDVDPLELFDALLRSRVLEPPPVLGLKTLKRSSQMVLDDVEGIGGKGGTEGREEKGSHLSQTGSKKRLEKRYSSTLEIASDPDFYDETRRLFRLSEDQLDRLIERSEAKYRAKRLNRTAKGVRIWIVEFIGRELDAGRARDPGSKGGPSSREASRALAEIRKRGS